MSKTIWNVDAGKIPMLITDQNRKQMKKIIKLLQKKDMEQNISYTNK